MEYALPFFGVIIGAIIAFIYKDHKSFAVKLLLSFSGAFLMALSLFILLPEVYHHLSAKRTGLLIMLGLLLQIILEFFSKGTEHGHIHGNSKKNNIPVLLMASLGLHSFLEGFPLHNHDTMIYGILIHKIPIALLLTSFLISSKLAKPVVAFIILLFAAMTPLGTWVSSILPVEGQLIHSVNALIVGVFLHVSTTIIFESSDGHKFDLTKLLAIVAGIIVAYLL